MRARKWSRNENVMNLIAAFDILRKHLHLFIVLHPFAYHFVTLVIPLRAERFIARGPSIQLRSQNMRI